MKPPEGGEMIQPGVAGPPEEFQPGLVGETKRIKTMEEGKGEDMEWS